MNIWNDPPVTVEERVGALLAAMTVEEKVGQLASFWPKPGNSTEIAGDVAPMEARHAAGISWADSVKHGLGHLTRNYGNEPVSVPEGLQRLREYQTLVVAESAFAIPAMAHEECLTGFTTLGATVYPTSIACGATFNPELVKRDGRRHRRRHGRSRRAPGPLTGAGRGP